MDPKTKVCYSGTLSQTLDVENIATARQSRSVRVVDDHRVRCPRSAWSSVATLLVTLLFSFLCCWGVDHVTQTFTPRKFGIPAFYIL